eukprot:scaffold11642_cov103-Isochrysis_galbana.AAC.2
MEMEKTADATRASLCDVASAVFSISILSLGVAKNRPITVSPTCRAMGDPSRYPEIRAARTVYALRWLPREIRDDRLLLQQWIDNNNNMHDLA